MSDSGDSVSDESEGEAVEAGTSVGADAAAEPPVVDDAFLLSAAFAAGASSVPQVCPRDAGADAGASTSTGSGDSEITSNGKRARFIVLYCIVT